MTSIRSFRETPVSFITFPNFGIVKLFEIFRQQFITFIFLPSDNSIIGILDVCGIEWSSEKRVKSNKIIRFQVLTIGEMLFWLASQGQEVSYYLWSWLRVKLFCNFAKWYEVARQIFAIRCQNRVVSGHPTTTWSLAMIALSLDFGSHVGNRENFIKTSGSRR